EAVARGAGAARVIEGEEGGSERRGGRPAGGAGRMLGETAPVPVVERHGDALAFAEGRRDRIRQPPPARGRRRDAIHHHQHLRSLPHPPPASGAASPTRAPSPLARPDPAAPRCRARPAARRWAPGGGGEGTARAEVGGANAGWFG